MQSVALVVQSTAAALVYIDCRMRHEGLDLDLLTYVERRDAGATAPPGPLSRAHRARDRAARRRSTRRAPTRRPDTRTGSLRLRGQPGPTPRATRRRAVSGSAAYGTPRLRTASRLRPGGSTGVSAAAGIRRSPRRMHSRPPTHSPRRPRRRPTRSPPRTRHRRRSPSSPRRRSAARRRAPRAPAAHRLGDAAGESAIDDTTASRTRRPGRRPAARLTRPTASRRGPDGTRRRRPRRRGAAADAGRRRGPRVGGAGAVRARLRRGASRRSFDRIAQAIGEFFERLFSTRARGTVGLGVRDHRRDRRSSGSSSPPSSCGACREPPVARASRWRSSSARPRRARRRHSRAAAEAHARTRRVGCRDRAALPRARPRPHRARRRRHSAGRHRPRLRAAGGARVPRAGRGPRGCGRRLRRRPLPPPPRHRRALPPGRGGR